MKIYFSGSIRGGREDVQVYNKIINQLNTYGKVLTEHVGDVSLGESGEEMPDKQIHDRDVDWLEQSDVVVAEVTQPSHGVGYEIGRAFAMNKRILCLFRPSSGKSLSPMIRGAHNDSSFIVKDYKEADVPEILKSFFGS